jgi:hypothetical protein
MAGEVRPYLIPTPSAVNWGAWHLLDAGAWVPLTAAMEGWDSGTDLRIARTVVVDRSQFETQTGLPLDAVALSVSWTSSTTGMTEAAPAARFNPKNQAVGDALLVGERLSGSVNLRTTIALATAVANPAPGVASVPGSVLAEDQFRIALEDVSPMFPVHALDFANTRLSTSASWHLETTTDLSAPFYASFRVLINARDKELSNAVARGAKDGRQQALLDELQAGVAVQLLELALMLRSELSDRDEWPEDSTGDVLQRTLASSMLDLTAPPAAHDMAAFRTLVAGAVRNAGKGRMFT